MPSDSTAVELHCETARATVLPDEGGVASVLVISGRSYLASTPWSSRVTPSSTPATDESGWVSRWRGGWQLCFPTAGHPQAGSNPPQGFHGTASQAPWLVTEAGVDFVVLEWADEHGLHVRRHWSLGNDRLTVSSTAENRGITYRPVVVAEHLILGGDFLAPVLGGGPPLEVLLPGDAGLQRLDYAGLPVGGVIAWPGDPSDSWDLIAPSTPARVCGLVDPDQKCVHLIGEQATATIRWRGLRHALLWEELAASADPPWNSRVIALGIEPTSTPHGAGTAAGTDVIKLETGGSITWSAELIVTVAADKHTKVGHS